MGFVYSECAFVENLLHQRLRADCPSLSSDSYTAEEYYLRDGDRGRLDVWTQCPLSLENAWDLNIKSTAGFGIS